MGGCSLCGRAARSDLTAEHVKCECEQRTTTGGLALSPPCLGRAAALQAGTGRAAPSCAARALLPGPVYFQISATVSRTNRRNRSRDLGSASASPMSPSCFGEADETPPGFVPGDEIRDELVWVHAPIIRCGHSGLLAGDADSFRSVNSTSRRLSAACCRIECNLSSKARAIRI